MRAAAAFAQHITINLALCFFWGLKIMQRHYVAPLCLTAALVSLFVCRIETASSDTFRAKDPGVRVTDPRNPNPGNALPGLTANQLNFFKGRTRFRGGTVSEDLDRR
jgi:hypothetical protein